MLAVLHSTADDVILDHVNLLLENSSLESIGVISGATVPYLNKEHHHHKLGLDKSSHLGSKTSYDSASVFCL